MNLDKNAPTYSIVIPPPNVTGILHMGHAAMLAFEDILTRFYRMRGYRALWIPGTDHAAIATQAKVENKVLQEEGKTRYDLGKEEFLQKVQEFASNSHSTIQNQIKKMGSSCDWSREVYTLDEVRTRAVRSVFKLMYEDGLIYQGERIVNWCPHCHSTLSDDEVEYKEQQSGLYTFKYSRDFPFAIATTRPETKLGDTAVAVNPEDERYKDYIGREYEVDFLGVTLKLKIVADSGVDPEFGTGALGVTPAHSMADWELAEKHGLDMVRVIDEDGRIKEGFGDFSGSSVQEARDKIVAKLEREGLLQSEEEADNNLSVCYRCDSPVEPLPSLQWFIDVNKKIPKFGQSIKELCSDAVRKGVFDRNKINIIPERFEKHYFHWIDNLRDWCISRQIWFGHQIPVWYNDKSQKSKVKNQKCLNFRRKDIFQAIKKGEKTVETRALNPEEKDRYFGDIKEGEEAFLNLKQEDHILDSLRTKIKRVKIYNSIEELTAEENIQEIMPEAKTEKDLIELYNNIPGYKDKIEANGLVALELGETEEVPENISLYVGVEPPQEEGWVQDEDTLDTWFSSGLWTFSTMAHSPEDIKIEDGKIKIDSSDFENFHPTSVLETGYDILFFWVARMIIMTTYAVEDIPFQDVYLHGLVLDGKGKKMSKSKGNSIDPLDMVDKYGTDSTRLSLVIGSSPGHDIKLSEEKVAGFRNFVNKLWNVGRFILTTYQEKQLSPEELQEQATDADIWIWERMRELIKEVTYGLQRYNFSYVGERLRDFTHHELADWYLEVSKFEDNKEVKSHILYTILRDLLKLWHPYTPYVTEVMWSHFNDSDLIVAEWPNASEYQLNWPRRGGENFDLIKDIIASIRNARAENQVEPGKKIKARIRAGEKKEILEANRPVIQGLRTN
ncbi:MAG TPA: class I tRNA ligase family protein, partial [Patescibacteria group bacterium]|nr:class I tRNA ligase family protein [Patescibacteria group bacterium]